MRSQRVWHNWATCNTITLGQEHESLTTLTNPRPFLRVVSVASSPKRCETASLWGREQACIPLAIKVWVLQAPCFSAVMKTHCVHKSYQAPTVSPPWDLWRRWGEKNSCTYNADAACHAVSVIYPCNETWSKTLVISASTHEIGTG